MEKYQSTGIDPYEPCTAEDEGMPWGLGATLPLLRMVLTVSATVAELFSRRK